MHQVISLVDLETGLEVRVVVLLMPDLVLLELSKHVQGQVVALPLGQAVAVDDCLVVHEEVLDRLIDQRVHLLLVQQMAEGVSEGVHSFVVLWSGCRLDLGSELPAQLVQVPGLSCERWVGQLLECHELLARVVLRLHLPEIDRSLVGLEGLC